jgi:hypothetical protein
LVAHDLSLSQSANLSIPPPLPQAIQPVSPASLSHKVDSTDVKLNPLHSSYLTLKSRPSTSDPSFPLPSQSGFTKASLTGSIPSNPPQHTPNPETHRTETVVAEETSGPAGTSNASEGSPSQSPKPRQRFSGFMQASTVAPSSVSNTGEIPPSPDFEDSAMSNPFFRTVTAAALMSGFRTAAVAEPEFPSVSTPPSPTRPGVSSEPAIPKDIPTGFMTASASFGTASKTGNALEPSAAAKARAARLLAKWDAEDASIMNTTAEDTGDMDASLLVDAVGAELPPPPLPSKPGDSSLSLLADADGMMDAFTDILAADIDPELGDDLPANQVPIPALSEFIGFSTAAGFGSASGKKILAPSAAALHAAEQRMNHWAKEDKDLDENVSTSIDVDEPSTHTGSLSEEKPGESLTISSTAGKTFVPSSSQGFTTPVRPRVGLPSLVSTPPVPTPSTPTPGGSLFARPASPANMSSMSPKPFKYPLASPFGRNNARPFKSPLPSASQVKLQGSSPLNPHTRASSSVGMRGVHPLASSPILGTAARTPTRFQSPARVGLPPFTPTPSGSLSTPRATPAPTQSQAHNVSRLPPLLVSTPRRTSQPRFSTPFKAGMAPGEPGRIALEREQERMKLEAKMAARAALQSLKPTASKKGKERATSVLGKFFDLSE